MERVVDFLHWLEGSIQALADFLTENVVERGFTVGDETVPFMVLFLLGTGVYLTLRLGFIQIRRLGHGLAVTTGKYDDPNEPGDVSHFQALTTALSATVGIGNIAGVALAIHWGGPGALFWMWVTAALGMATKYTEVTLAQKYRTVEGPDYDAKKWEGTVSGGPMYYIERGLGKNWKWMAVFFAIMLGSVGFFTGNAIQANTVADTLVTEFGDYGVAKWMSGLATSVIVAAVILGGITRIGRVTSILAPLMAVVYVSGAMLIILLNFGEIIPTLTLVFTEAFNPTSGIAGTGVGAVLVTMMYGVRRGLFSNEAGQGSAPIAHAAAKTDEPVSEGVVALLEPFIDTLLICTMTGMVLIMTGVWSDRLPSEITMSGGDLSWVTVDESGGYDFIDDPQQIQLVDGRYVRSGPGAPMVGWHEVGVEQLFLDDEHTQPFTGTILPAQRLARDQQGNEYQVLYGMAAESGAPLTMEAFRRGLSRLGDWGHYIVLISVMLFAVSTAISWSYYGDRCAHYLLGPKAVLPYKLMFVGMHFAGAVLPLAVAWILGDVLLAIVIIPNLIALVLLVGKVVKETDSYFERKPWVGQPKH